MKPTITIIGAGNVGTYVASGITEAALALGKVTITRNKSPFSSEEKKRYVCLRNNKTAITKAKVIIIAVQPKQVDEVISSIKSSLTAGQLIISVVSGASIERIKMLVGRTDVSVVRAMPNVAIAVRRSMTCLAFDGASKEHKKLVEIIFSSVGKTLVIPEEKFPQATVLVGSGPAFVAKFIRLYMQAAIQAGFNEHEALMMVEEVVIGTGLLLSTSGSHPEVMIDKVTTPDGCTIAGIAALEHEGFGAALLKGIMTAILRAKELYAKK